MINIQISHFYIIIAPQQQIILHFSWFPKDERMEIKMLLQ